MTQRNDCGPAFPESTSQDGPYGGMSLRQYAAIKLRVPDSGTDWLDDMIRQSLRTDLAVKAMQAFLSGHIAHYGHENHWPYDQMASEALSVADALLAARERT